MNAKSIARIAPAIMLACHLLAGAALAQQPPSATAIAAARELVELKGGSAMFDPVVINVIEQTRGALLQTNPQLSKDLDAVTTQLRNEFGPKRNELLAEAAKLYATRFTEQEIKDMVAFYKSPLGRKMIAQEPVVLDETFNYVQQWAPRVGEEVMNRFRAEMRKKGHNL
jgi:uncharacterized protein